MDKASTTPTTTHDNRPIDHDLWTQARRVLGKPQAVVLFPCPRCGKHTLAWSGMRGAGAYCLSDRCGCHYNDFKQLLDGHEQYLAAKRAQEIRDMMESHDTYRREGGKIKQVRQARIR
jgi:predicted RNA-binding Zn-ribbon protein involved in translation (DUF1610 family)